MSRVLLLEHNAPTFASPDQWKVELVEPRKFDEGLIESYVSDTEERFNRLSESLMKNGNLTESEAQKVLNQFKDSFVHELREAHKAKRMRVSGPAQVENQQNGNGRVYPTELWDRVLGENSDFMGRLGNRQVLGELEHPTEGNTRLPRVSHLVEKVWRQEGVVYAQHLIFHTPNGKIVEELYKAGAVPGVSSRGAGSTRSVDGADVVEASDFHLDTWDFVAQPSVVTARPSEVVESTPSKTSVAVPEKVESVPISVNTTESSADESGVSTMPQLHESSDALVNGKSAIANSQAYLESGQVTLKGLMEHQTKVSDVLSNLPTSVPKEYEESLRDLRASLREHASTLRREINRKLQEQDDEMDGKDGGDGSGDGNDVNINVDADDTPDKETDEALSKVFTTEERKRMTRAQMVEALVNEVTQLREHEENSVPLEKYRLSIKIGEALVNRTKKDKKTYESDRNKLATRVQESEKTSKASKSLLESTIGKYRSEQVAATVEKLIQRNPQLESVRSRLMECPDRAALKALLEGTIQPILEGQSKPQRSDLPPVHQGTLNESQKGAGTSPASQASKPSGNLMETLIAGERNPQNYG